MTPTDAAAWVTAIAAAVQAVTALVIVALTVWLARTARNALLEARREAKVAEAALTAAERQAQVAEGALAEASAQTKAAMTANDEARKLRQLGAVPLLVVNHVQDLPDSRTGSLVSVFKIRNPGPSVALDIQLLLFGMSVERVPEHGDRKRSRAIPMLGAGDELEIRIWMDEFRNVPAPWAPADGSRFSNDWIRVVAHCQGVLGAKVEQHIDWSTNKGDYWELRSVKIRPDPSDPQWQIVVDQENRH